MTPTVSWKGKFEVMQNKLNLSISKLMQTNMNPFQAAIYHNTQMIKIACFGRGIVELNNEQERERSQKNA